MQQGVLRFLQRIADCILFSSLYIALCSVIMVAQTCYLFQIPINWSFILFVFAGSLCSYNFHWYLTPELYSSSYKTMWSVRHKNLHLFLFIASLFFAAYCSLSLLYIWPWLVITALITFLYSAPKLPFKVFQLLKRVAIGKTIFLAFVWTHITSILPVVIAKTAWNSTHLLYIINRFSLIYSICILFDYRDREEDQKQGIKSLITILSEKGIGSLFWGSIVIFICTDYLLYRAEFALVYCFALLIPGLLVAMLYHYAKRNTSDYFYHFVLDGLMMLSALLLPLFERSFS